MELLVASAIGVIMAAGVYLLLRGRTFPVVLGLTMMTYAVNLFLFITGRLTVDQAPVLHQGHHDFADPLPQALVLTAIVISFGMTAVIVVMALKSYVESESDHVDLQADDDREADS